MNNVSITVKDSLKILKQLQVESPTCWEECSPLQVQKMVLTIATVPNEYDCKIALLRLALKGVKKSYFYSFEDAVIFDMFSLIEWCFTDNLVTPVVSKFRHRFKKYYLPKAKLENISCLEWWKAESYYTKFQESKDPQYIDQLIGTICRQKNRNIQEGIRRDDIRKILVSQMQIDKNTKRLTKLDNRLKIYTLYFFSGCKKWVHKTYKKYLFPDENVEGENNERESDANPFGWYGIYQQVAESGVFGTLENILINVKFIDLCAYLVAKKIEEDRIERKRQELKSNTNDTV